MRVIEVSAEQRRNERAGETDDPEKSRRPTASSGTIPTSENSERPGRGLNPGRLGVLRTNRDGDSSGNTDVLDTYKYMDETAPPTPAELRHCQRKIGTPLANQLLVTSLQPAAQPVGYILQHAIANQKQAPLPEPRSANQRASALTSEEPLCRYRMVTVK
ncbi:hypothetical protein PR048_031665 [Dryococelus australis]|uniref:Uncharacterized protein n=1 Tax=Dryococelus australis TaxID=614101 RepID=A0ABQ9G5X4_9NEOP|nr:hypothetical protein PR048_031665 [Dryococelus australis]